MHLPRLSYTHCSFHLALLEILRFMRETVRVNMADAKTPLFTLHTFQQAHYYEMDRYGLSLDIIVFQ